jgi:hypothetical protein
MDIVKSGVSIHAEGVNSACGCGCDFGLDHTSALMVGIMEGVCFCACGPSAVHFLNHDGMAFPL